MSEYSYATQRKIKIIEERMGSNWKQQVGKKSIDSVYNELMGDTRRNLFCKIDADVKDKLDEMSKHHREKMADFIEQIILSEWSRYEQRRVDGERKLLEDFLE